MSGDTDLATAPGGLDLTVPDDSGVVALVRREDLNGAPYELTPGGIELVERWAAAGASNNVIAGKLGCARDTLRLIRRRQPEVDEALARGRAIDEALIANVLRAKALNGDTVAALFYLKARHGWREGTERDGQAAVNVAVISLPANLAPADYVASLERAHAAIPGEPDDGGTND